MLRTGWERCARGFGVLNNPFLSLSLGCLSSLLGSEKDIHTYTSLLESQYISEGQHSFSASLSL